MVRARAALLSCALATATLPLRAAPVTYVLEPGHSWVQFSLLHFGTSTIHGRLGPAAGWVSLDRAAGSGTVSVTVPTDTVSTGSTVFDARLRKDDLLATAANPTAWFIARNLRLDGDRLVELRGEFTFRGVTQLLTLHTVRFACYDNPVVKREVCGGDFEGELKRSDFGMPFGLPFVGDQVKLQVQVEGVRQ